MITILCAAKREKEREREEAEAEADKKKKEKEKETQQRRSGERNYNRDFFAVVCQLRVS